MLRAVFLLAATALFSASAIATLPVPTDNSPALRIQGSNTIGAQLGPALAEGLMRKQGLLSVLTEAGVATNELRVIGTAGDGPKVIIEVAAHGSGTGFTALKSGKADLAASSRPIKEKEATELGSLGNMKSQRAEQVIAIDGVAVILHPANPLRQFTIEQLAGIFSGEIHDWQQLGGTAGEIHLYARDEKSGTFETFKELVLSKYAKSLARNAARFESSEQLSDQVSQDRQAIGFIGLPYVRHAKAVAVVDGDSRPMLPTISLIATEDYPLSRRLYLYLPAELHHRWALAFVQFAQSPEGQAIVAQNGFVAQTVQAVKVQPTAQMPAEYQALARDSERLSVNFRFAQGSATLDNKALRDLDRVVDYLKRNDKLNQRVTLVGFADAKSDPQRAALLSRLRAMAVRRELVKNKVMLRDVRGLGDEMPVASNTVEAGRIKNRRVEVWVD
ncbi:substrate-binding domain-containing protein [Pseudomonas caspiana]